MVGRAGIYMLIAPDGKKYIGQSIDLARRINDYVEGRGHARIGAAIKKFGFDKFKIKCLHLLPKGLAYKDAKKRLDLLEYESIIDYKTLYPSGLNCVLPHLKKSDLLRFWRSRK